MAKRHNKNPKSTATVATVTAPYRQVAIRGVLTLRSELHIGSSASKNTGANEVELDAKGRPYLPGSSVRGALASLLKQSDLSDHHRRLFGLARQSNPEDSSIDSHDEGGTGLLKVFDACVYDPDSAEDIKSPEMIQRSRTRIDPVTGTAMEHHLATHDLVPVGTCFELKLLLDHAGTSVSGITDEEVQALLSLLNALNQLSLGMGKSIGQGQLNWKCNVLEVVSEADYRRWLLNNLQQKANTPAKVSIKPLSSIRKPPEQAFEGIPQVATLWSSELFGLTPLSPILINDPQAVDKAAAEEDATHSFNHLFLQRSQDGQQYAVIPGSTLKGWFRAQSRRILLTLTQGDKQAIVDELLGEIFGSTEHGSSLIQFDDASVAITENDTHEQTFNAVDRFTGGVKDSALFSVSALWSNQSITGKLHYKKSLLLTGWMRLLLLFVWNDAKEGDLVVGWGKNKGFGRLVLTSEEETSCLESSESIDYEQWQSELYERLELPSVEASHE